MSLGLAMLMLGNAPEAVTVTVEVAVQPFVVFVAVTVYVPAAPTVAGFAALIKLPPFHTMVLPALVPVSVALAEMQSMLLLLAADTVGGIVLVDTVTVEVDVQPFAASVEVTVYVPAALTVAGFEALLNAPPFQTIVPELVPVNVTLDVVQVIFPDVEDETIGGVVLLETETVCVEVQPLLGSVTVNVYVAPEDTG